MCAQCMDELEALLQKYVSEMKAFHFEPAYTLLLKMEAYSPLFNEGEYELLRQQFWATRAMAKGFKARKQAMN